MHLIPPGSTTSAGPKCTDTRSRFTPLSLTGNLIGAQPSILPCPDPRDEPCLSQSWPDPTGEGPPSPRAAWREHGEIPSGKAYGPHPRTPQNTLAPKRMGKAVPSPSGPFSPSPGIPRDLLSSPRDPSETTSACPGIPQESSQQPRGSLGTLLSSLGTLLSPSRDPPLLHSQTPS